MEERKGLAFASHEPLADDGKRLHAGETAPGFSLDYLDLADLAVRTVGLADVATACTGGLRDRPARLPRLC